jgi:hypothetical protein
LCNVDPAEALKIAQRLREQHLSNIVSRSLRQSCKRRYPTNRRNGLFPSRR